MQVSAWSHNPAHQVRILSLCSKPCPAWFLSKCSISFLWNEGPALPSLCKLRPQELESSGRGSPILGSQDFFLSCSVNDKPWPLTPPWRPWSRLWPLSCPSHLWSLLFVTLHRLPAAMCSWVYPETCPISSIRPTVVTPNLSSLTDNRLISHPHSSRVWQPTTWWFRIWLLPSSRTRTSTWLHLENAVFLCVRRKWNGCCTNSIVSAALGSICFLRAIYTQCSPPHLPQFIILSRAEKGLDSWEDILEMAFAFPPPEQKMDPRHSAENLRPYIILQIGLFLTSVSPSFLSRSILCSLLGTCSEKRYSSDRCLTNI